MKNIDDLYTNYLVVCKETGKCSSENYVFGQILYKRVKTRLYLYIYLGKMYFISVTINLGALYQFYRSNWTIVRVFGTNWFLFVEKNTIKNLGKEQLKKLTTSNITL